MTFSFAERPYLVQNLDSGLKVTRNPSFDEEKKQLGESCMFWSTLSNSEVDFYTHLRQWFEPVLREQKLSLKSVYADPKDLPNVLRSLPKESRTALVVNTFPAMGEKWMFTTSGLNNLGLLNEYKTDILTNPDNHWICVPTTLRRMKIVGINYFKEWKAFIDGMHLPLSKWTGHMMAIRPDRFGSFVIGDQYGTGHIADNQLIQMGDVRNSFNGRSMYHVQVFVHENF